MAISLFDARVGWRVLPWVVVTKAQLTKLVSERNQGKSIIMCAQKSGMSANTARKHLRQDNVTEQKKAPHSWRTRADPLEAVWPEAVRMLRDAPELEAKALFEHLSQRHPGTDEVGGASDLPAEGAQVAAGGGAGEGGVLHPGPRAGQGAGDRLDGYEVSLKITIAGRAFEPQALPRGAAVFELGVGGAGAQ